MIKFFNQIIYLNVIVALATGILSAGFTFELNFEKWYLYGVFAFFATLSVYNGQRLFKSNMLKQTPWLKWVRDNRKGLMILSLVSGFSAGGTFLLMWKPELNSAIILLLSGLISMFYVVKVNGKNMREVPYLKIHLIALTWTLILILFPLINEGHGAKFWPTIAHYLYVLAVTIPFDIRDLKYDTPSQKTIPQIVGVARAKIISIALLVLFVILMFNFVDGFLMFNPVFYLAVIVQIILVLKMNEKRSDGYCAGAIDGAIALLGISYFIH